MNQFRDEERWAQGCIQHALPDCTVEPHDDGSRDSTYDLRIVYSDGSMGAVEVTAAVDSPVTPAECSGPSTKAATTKNACPVTVPLAVPAT